MNPRARRVVHARFHKGAIAIFLLAPFLAGCHRADDPGVRRDAITRPSAHAALVAKTVVATQQCPAEPSLERAERSDPEPGSARAAYGDIARNCETGCASAPGIPCNCVDHRRSARIFVGADTASAQARGSGQWSSGKLLAIDASCYQDQGGRDLGENGIDGAMLFFYAGHGEPGLLHTLDGDVKKACPRNIRWGNAAGKTRYAWLCACHTFAHGTRQSTSGDYISPRSFNGGEDSGEGSGGYRNVFERWGPSLGDGLRMACGGSSNMWCQQPQMEALRDNALDRKMPPAIAFIEALGGLPLETDLPMSTTPLCMARGGEKVADTPLFDAAFNTEANTSGASHLHLLYAQAPIVLKAPASAAAKTTPPLPSLRLAQRGMHTSISEVRSAPEEHHSAPLEETVSARSEQLPMPMPAPPFARHVETICEDTTGADPVTSEAAAYVRRIALKLALSASDKSGNVPNMDQVVSLRCLRTQSVPASHTNDPPKDIAAGWLIEIQQVLASTEGNVLFPERSMLTTLMPAFGKPGEIAMTRPGTGGMVVDGQTIPIVTKTSAETAARAMLHDPEAYRAVAHTLGYERADDSDNGRLDLVYTFYFVPKSDAPEPAPHALEPVLVKVPAVQPDPR